MVGWKTKNNNSTTGLELWRNAGPSAFQLQVSIFKSDKIWCAYLVLNCVSLRTFWTPLVFAGLSLLMLIPLLLPTKSFCRTLLNHIISKVVHDSFSFRREVLANRPRLRQVRFGDFFLNFAITVEYWYLVSPSCLAAPSQPPTRQRGRILLARR